LKRVLCLILLAGTFLSCGKDLVITRVDEGDASLIVSRKDRPWNPGVEEMLNFRLKGGSGNLELRFQPEGVENMEIAPYEPQDGGGTLSVTVLKGGSYTFPELKFLADGDLYFTVPEWDFEVNALAGESGEMRPDSGPLTMGLLKTWQWALIVFLLAIAVLLFFFIRYRRKQKEAEESRLSVRLAAELNAYRESQPLDRLSGRDFYLELTALMRHFLDRVYHLGTSGATREEFLPVMLGLSLFRSTEHPWLISFWEKADRIKFAALENDRKEREDDLRKLLKILEEILSVQKEKELHEPG